MGVGGGRIVRGISKKKVNEQWKRGEYGYGKEYGKRRGVGKEREYVG